MPDKNKPKITIGPDGTIRVDEEEKPDVSNTKIGSDGTIHVSNSGSSTGPRARQKSQPTTSKSKDKKSGARTSARQSNDNSPRGTEFRNTQATPASTQTQDTESKGATGCLNFFANIIASALLGGVAMALGGGLLGLPILGVVVFIVCFIYIQFFSD
ncbi:hypothetical protein [Collinsella intestinalis]|uniref:hypothetical protein n=1 Tax=Collinsella intestinalis TaxID=147207 RepID=UPI00195F0029|nr:hypothetical protein [Collinsella intestinalis]MBM6942553.1 hypothetical protein [Collinsella intestinalis]